MFRTRLAVASVLGAAALSVTALSGGVATAAPVAAAPTGAVQPALKKGEVRFAMTPSSTDPKCLPGAKTVVSIQPRGPVEVMYVHATGLPKNTEFDLFVLQVPKPPFGMAWYQGDLETNKKGEALGKFIGRFNEETFSVAVGEAPAPVVHSSPTKDADKNPKTAPLHQYHLGYWFNSADDAVKAGCAGNVTPFNGEHNAGVQAFNTSSFADDQGPLRQVKP